MKQLRAGLIGCGNIFAMHAYSLKALDGAVVAAVCDIDKKRADDAGEKFSCRVFYDYKEMIDSGEIDVVHVLTPHYLHSEMCLYALEKGLFVICEKPMAITDKEALAMYEAGKKSGGKLAIIFQNRHNPESVFAKEKIESGLLGKPLGAKVIVTWRRSDEYYAADAWRGTLDQEGGGVIINQAIHSFDLVRWLLGKEVISVEANIENRMHPTIEVEDEAAGIVHFEDNVNAVFFATNNNSHDDAIEVALHYENAKIRIMDGIAEIKYNDKTIEKSEMDKSIMIDFGTGAKTYWGVSHYRQLEKMYKAFAEGGTDFYLEEGYKTFKMIDMLYKSGRGN